MTAWCASVNDMIAKLEDQNDDEISVIGYYGGDRGLHLSPPQGGARLLEAIRKCNRPCVKEGLSLSFLYLKDWNYDWCRDFERELMKVWAETPLVTKMLMEMERGNLDEDKPGHGDILAQGFDECPHATGVGNRYATKSFIIKACKAALKKPHMETLEVTTNLVKKSFDDEEVHAMAMVKMKFPECLVGGSRALNSTIASKAIVNPMAEISIRCYQRNIMEAYVKDNIEVCTEEYDKLKTEVAVPEQNRLLLLLPLLCEKYCIVGGLELLKICPPDFDNHDLKQFMPVEVSKYPEEDQVRFLLAIADYKAGVLNDIADHVTSEINQLGKITDGKNQADITKTVDDFFLNHGLAECFATLDAYKIQVNHGHSKSCRPVSGNYEQCGFANGNPAFFSKQHAIYMYYFTSNGISSWSFSNILSSNISNCNLPSETSGPRAGQKRPRPFVEEGDHEKWQTFNGCQTPHLEGYKYEKPVQEGVVDFLSKRRGVHAPHLVMKDQLVDVHFGPPKGFDRALQKGAAWLRDLNRCTFVFDSPALMVLGFKLLDEKVKGMGGELVRLNNFFFREGELEAEPRAPPCLHLNYSIEDYIYEVMLTLSDFYTAKARVHKFYDIARAKRPIETAKSVFTPLPLDASKEVFPEGSDEKALSDSIKRKIEQKFVTASNASGGGVNAIRELKGEEKTKEVEKPKEEKPDQATPKKTTGAAVAAAGEVKIAEQQIQQIKDWAQQEINSMKAELIKQIQMGK
jgi:hypothetical protein